MISQPALKLLCHACNSLVSMNNFCVCGQPGCTGCRTCCTRRKNGTQTIEEKHKIKEHFEMRMKIKHEDIEAYERVFGDD